MAGQEPCPKRGLTAWSLIFLYRSRPEEEAICSIGDDKKRIMYKNSDCPEGLNNKIVRCKANRSMQCSTLHRRFNATDCCFIVQPFRAVAIFIHIFVFCHRGYHIASSSGLDLYKNIRLQALRPVFGQAPRIII